MINFTLQKRFVLSPEVTEKTIIAELKEQIDEVFERKKFLPDGNVFAFEGILRSCWKSCNIKARIRLEIKDGHIFDCQIDGKVYSNAFLENCGGIIILWIVSSLFGWFRGLLWLMILIGAAQAAAFVYSCKNPERQLRRILDAIQLEYGLPAEEQAETLIPTAD